MSEIHEATRNYLYRADPQWLIINDLLTALRRIERANRHPRMAAHPGTTYAVAKDAIKSAEAALAALRKT